MPHCGLPMATEKMADTCVRRNSADSLCDNVCCNIQEGDVAGVHGGHRDCWVAMTTYHTTASAALKSASHSSALADTFHTKRAGINMTN